MPESDSTGNGTRKALIISVSNYDNLQKLDFCKNDGEKIYDILKSQNYEILQEHKLIGNVNHDQIKNAIIDFFKGENVKRRDTLFFYFSGHGFFDGEGDTYLSTSDFDPDQPDKKGYRFDELTRQMNKSISSKIVVALDCCYSGAAGLGGKGEGDAEKLGRDALDSSVKNKIKWGEGRCILASSLGYQESFRMSGEPYSAFTYFLAKGLEGANGKSVDEHGFVTPALLGRYVTDKLLEMPRPMQRPILKLELTGEIVLANHPDIAPPKPVPTPVFEPQPWYKSKVMIMSIMIIAGTAVGGTILFLNLDGGTGYAEEYVFDELIRLPQDPIISSVTTDASGYLYVADSANQRIIKLSSSGELEDWEHDALDGSIYAVIGILSDRSGGVYVYPILSNPMISIKKFTADGVSELWEYKSGGEFYSVSAITTDSVGNLYVLDGDDDNILIPQKFASDGIQLEWMPDDLYGLQYVFDILADSSGHVYVIGHDPDVPQILKFTTDGEPDGKWKVRDENGNIVSNIGNQNTISLNNIFILTIGGDVQQILKFTTDGVLIGQWDVRDENNKPIFAITINADQLGNVYVGDNSKILKFNADGVLINELKIDAGLSNKLGMGLNIRISDFTIDSSGNVYVISYQSSTVDNRVIRDRYNIVKFTSQGDLDSDWLNEYEFYNRVSIPAMDVDSSDNLYVGYSTYSYDEYGERGFNKIQKFVKSKVTDISSKLDDEWKVYSTSGEFIGPSSISTDSSGNIHLTDRSSRIQKYDTFGKLLGEQTVKGSYNETVTVIDISVGDLYTYVTTLFGTIVKLTNDGRFVKDWDVGLPEEIEQGGYDSLGSISTDPSGNVYVVSVSDDRIIKYTDEGVFLTTWGTHGIKNGEFLGIVDIDIDSSGNVYVVDQPNHRIQKFTGDGKFLAVWGGGKDVIGGLDKPSRISVDSDDNVYVLDNGENQINIYEKVVP